MSLKPLKIAATHPGKHGDCIYALPAVKKLCELLGMRCDFYTSDYCAPLKTLFEYQSYVDHFYVAPNYVIERMDMGVQPYYVPVDGSLYHKVFHMGFRSVPDQSIPTFIGESVGVQVDPVMYEVPEWESPYAEYLVLATRGDTSYRNLFQQIIDLTQIPIILVGGAGEQKYFRIEDRPVLVRTGEDYLQTASIIAKSKGFVGLMSSQLCLANGFNIPKVIPHDGRSWDMRHIVDSEKHFYLVDPDADDILGVFDALLQDA